MQNCMILSTEMIRCCHARCFIAIFSVVVESVAGASVSIHLIRLSLIFICSKIWVFFDRINLGESAWNVCVFDRNNPLFVCLFFFLVVFSLFACAFPAEKLAEDNRFIHSHLTVTCETKINGKTHLVD